ncbi:hypothetical protein AAFF_G00310900 [Aldrovandia affinis]|uniref:Uncharacterized protein n=1 Tax=Aldrovandia affinis TaxID=143900 RepID=A0AAD7R879_9TELE|nr:hypothetical protein AAFF_G00310900 [Aldrovandia affinis]
MGAEDSQWAERQLPGLSTNTRPLRREEPDGFASAFDPRADTAGPPQTGQCPRLDARQHRGAAVPLSPEAGAPPGEPRVKLLILPILHASRISHRRAHSVGSKSCTRRVSHVPNAAPLGPRVGHFGQLCLSLIT